MKVAIWTDNDLDGAGSALALKYFFKGKEVTLTIKELSDQELVNEIPTWIEKNYDSYDKIFFCDMYIPNEVKEKIDREKVIVIDHHSTHVEEKTHYKKCKTIIEDYTSCTKLIQNKFKIDINQDQAKLLSIIDDYDCYALKYKESLFYNAIYNSYNRPRVDKFIASFSDGVREFNLYENNTINLFFKKYKDIITNLEVYEGKIKDYKVVSCFCDSNINEVSNYMLKKYNADISAVVNLKTKNVSFRKNKQTCKLDLSKLSKALCEGGGHASAAGGKITEAFLSFTKTLNKCT